MSNLNKLRKFLLPLAIMSLAILAIWSNVRLNTSAFPTFKGNFSSYYGIIIALILIFLNGTLISNYIHSAVLAMLTSSIGIFLKINFYVLPTFKKAASLEKFKVAFFPYIDFLSTYYLLVIAFAVLISIFATYLSKKVQKLNEKRLAIKAEKKLSKKKFLDAKMMSYIAVFVALSVVVNVLRVGSLSFGGFPIIFSGFVLGPLGGFIVGAISDVLSFIIRPSGQFNILFTLTSGLTGAIPIIVVRLLGVKNNKFSLWKVIMGIGVGQLITSVILVPIFIALFMGTEQGFAYYAIKALVKQSLSVPVYSIVLVSLYESLMRSGIKLENAN